MPAAAPEVGRRSEASATGQCARRVGVCHRIGHLLLGGWDRGLACRRCRLNGCSDGPPLHVRVNRAVLPESAPSAISLRHG